MVGGAGFGYLSLPDYRPLPNEGAVVRNDPQTDAVTAIADLSGYERAKNPDGTLVDSNPWDIVVGADGNLYVSDAGGNDVLKVNPTSGQIATAAVIPGQPGAAPNPGRGNRNEVDPVPTGLAAGEDGSLYVGTLPGGPTVQGAAKVIRIAPNGAQSDAVTGLTYVVALTPGPDGMLYVTELYSGVDTS